LRAPCSPECEPTLKSLEVLLDRRGFWLGADVSLHFMEDAAINADYFGVYRNQVLSVSVLDIRGTFSWKWEVLPHDR
jgi:hypothetical protein